MKCPECHADQTCALIVLDSEADEFVPCETTGVGVS